LTLSGGLANEGWEALLSALVTVGKYAALDLSACTMNGTEFDPGTDAGADKVTALILPDAVKSVPAGIWGTARRVPFRAFTNLTSISGEGIENVGDLAFSYCTSLASVSLPAMPPRA
jgi:hypothetical protein